MALSKSNLPLAESLVQNYRAQQGVTPEMIEALSWLGRGALAAKQFDQAEAYAKETERLSLAELKKRPLDAEPHLPLALGAAIEVQAQVLNERGQRADAVELLRKELASLPQHLHPRPSAEEYQSAQPGRQGRAGARRARVSGIEARAV